MKITQCKGEGQGSCKLCDEHGIFNRDWMSFLYKIEGYEGCYCENCINEIKGVVKNDKKLNDIPGSNKDK